MFASNYWVGGKIWTFNVSAGRVLSISEKLVQNGLLQVELPCGSLAPGIYLLRVDAGPSTVVQKFVRE